MTSETNPSANGKNIRLLTQALTTAIKLWLRTQLTQVSHIQVEIGASDRQLLSGYIPSLFIFSTHAVYQGLHVTRIQIWAENIRINTSSILKGKPLQLLAVVPVVAEMLVEVPDLQQSLSSKLLSTALNDLLVQLLPEILPKFQGVSWEKITVDNQSLIVKGVVETDHESIPLQMRAGLALVNGQELKLKPIYIHYNKEMVLENDLGYNLDLGSDVDLQELSLNSQQLLCRGKINVNP